MAYIQRSIQKPLPDSLGKSILLLGARQSGKTTLIKHLNLSDIHYTLLDTERRLSFERSPKRLQQEIAAYKLKFPQKNAFIDN